MNQGNVLRHEGTVTQTAKPRARPPDPLRALAEQARLRCYRDASGDWNIPGRWGEIFWYGSGHDGLPDRIGVQIGGPRANGTATAIPVGSNKRIKTMTRRWGKPSQRGDGEAVFILSANRIWEAAQAIRAWRRRSLSPELRTAAVEHLKRIRCKSRTKVPIEDFRSDPAQQQGSSG